MKASTFAPPVMILAGCLGWGAAALYDHFVDDSAKNLTLPNGHVASHGYISEVKYIKDHGCTLDSQTPGQREWSYYDSKFETTGTYDHWKCPGESDYIGIEEAGQ